MTKKKTNTKEAVVRSKFDLSMEDASEIISILGDQPLKNLKEIIVRLDMIEHGCWGHVNGRGKWKPGRSPDSNAKFALSRIPTDQRLRVLNEYEKEAGKY